MNDYLKEADRLREEGSEQIVAKFASLGRDSIPTDAVSDGVARMIRQKLPTGLGDNGVAQVVHHGTLR